MSLRRYGPPLVLAFASLLACTDVKQEKPAPQLVIATFASPNIPTPNDLVLQAVPTLPDGAQKELLQSFIDAGGFPSDQEVTITIPFRAVNWNGSAYVETTPPDLDPATVTPATVALLKVDGAPQAVEFEVGSATAGRLVLRKKADASGSRRFAPGRYVVAVRGGASGVKTTAAQGAMPVNADQAIAIAAPNKDLTVKENQPPGLTPALVAQLEAVRKVLWSPLTWGNVNGLWTASVDTTVTPAFAAVAPSFAPTEVATIATFGIAPAAAQPLTDSGSGQLPLPSTFLLDGTRPSNDPPTRFFVRNVPAFGPAAAGLATLDGFSTTGMMLAPLTQPVAASTVNAQTVLVFELPEGAGAPRRMRDVAAALGAGAPATAEYLTQPPALNRTVQVNGADVAVTTAIGLQPGVAVPVPGVGIVPTPPLKEKRNYAVVITDGVKDLAGNPLERSTLANILFTFTNPPAVDGVSQLVGVSDADATALANLRAGLEPLLANLGALTGGAVTRDNVVMAYTVQTQTVTDVSVGLSALPYQTPAAFSASGIEPLDLAALGLPATLFPSVGSFLTATVPTIDAIDPATGALNPDQAQWSPTGIPAVVALPRVDATCTPAAPCARPLVIWHHGLSGGRLQMLTVADSLAAKGFVVAAIDAPYHGDRAFCMDNNECTTDGTADGVCTPDQARAGQGDAIPPGTCTTGHLRGTNLTTEASGNYFISGNFFRIRDAVRQDLLDHAALVLALAPPQFPATTAFADALAQAGLRVDPGAVYLEGQSLGGIIGTELLATNPRFARGVLNVPGGTLVDVFTNAPAFAPAVDQLFLSLGIDRSQIPTDPAVASRYVQTLILAKWILDPADPLNYAVHVGTKLPSPLLAAPPAGLGDTGLVHPTTEVLGQLARCDQVVPNATTVVGGVPLPYGDELLALAGAPTTLYVSASAPNNCVPHGVLNDTLLPTSIGGQVRDDAAQFLLDLTVPAATVTLP
jgi:dienelactone hydrolase